jgi:hypothetical protein
MVTGLMKLRHLHHAFNGNARRSFFAHGDGKFGLEVGFCKSLLQIKIIEQMERRVVMGAIKMARTFH